LLLTAPDNEKDCAKLKVQDGRFEVQSSEAKEEGRVVKPARLKLDAVSCIDSEPVAKFCDWRSKDPAVTVPAKLATVKRKAVSEPADI